MGHIYSAPDALLEPGLVLVAVDGDEVAGFAAGAIDTLLWEEVLERTCCPAGVGSMLLKAWLELASKRGATAVHVGVNRANLRALRFRCHDVPG